MFVTKLMERELKNFTRISWPCKSVFCFENRMICLEQVFITAITNIQPKQLSSKVHSKKGKSTILVNGEEEKRLVSKRNFPVLLKSYFLSRTVTITTIS